MIYTKEEMSMKENVINSFIDTIGKYFETHKDAMTFEIGKGALAYLCGIGMTSTEALCQGIALETISVQDLRGKIIVERDGFKEWLGLRLQAKQKKIQTDQEIALAVQEAYGPERELNNQLRRKANALEILKKRKQMIPKLEAEVKEIEKETEELKTSEEIADEKLQAYREAHEEESESYELE